MKFNITIKNVATVEEISNYWQNQDYINLLEQFDFPDANTVKPENLMEMLQMAITDFEPNEAAGIVLTYKLSERLNEGQIAQISNDMLLDKVCEEYPEIDLHYDLFNITKATVVDFSLISKGGYDTEITKEIVLKSFNNGISASNLIKRLFAEQMSTDHYYPKL